MKFFLLFGGLLYWISENRLLTALFTIDAAVLTAVLFYFNVSGALLSAPVCIALLLQCALIADKIVNRK